MFNNDAVFYFKKNKDMTKGKYSFKYNNTRGKKQDIDYYSFIRINLMGSTKQQQLLNQNIVTISVFPCMVKSQHQHQLAKTIVGSQQHSSKRQQQHKAARLPIGEKTKTKLRGALNKKRISMVESKVKILGLNIFFSLKFGSSLF